jgi:hypothetical protein
MGIIDWDARDLCAFVVDPALIGLQLRDHVDGDGAMIFELSVEAKQSPAFVQLG